MKTKKTMTEKVIAANRANAQKTTGPQNTSAVSQNALKHGLLAKHVLFRNEEEKVEFNTEASCPSSLSISPVLMRCERSPVAIRDAAALMSSIGRIAREASHQPPASPSPSTTAPRPDSHSAS